MDVALCNSKVSQGWGGVCSISLTPKPFQNTLLHSLEPFCKTHVRSVLKNKTAIKWSRRACLAMPLTSSLWWCEKMSQKLHIKANWFKYILNEYSVYSKKKKKKGGFTAQWLIQEHLFSLSIAAILRFWSEWNTRARLFVLRCVCRRTG